MRLVSGRGAVEPRRRAANAHWPHLSVGRPGRGGGGAIRGNRRRHIHRSGCRRRRAGKQHPLGRQRRGAGGAPGGGTSPPLPRPASVAGGGGGRGATAAPTAASPLSARGGSGRAPLPSSPPATMVPPPAKCRYRRRRRNRCRCRCHRPRCRRCRRRRSRRHRRHGRRDWCFRWRCCRNGRRNQEPKQPSVTRRRL
ncbi:hypothetical protein BU14_0239s0005 [Porphyra umbilicalis]|uniref:Uncharacterized protein n=1 Tax=Porphyra umbilicalis TaxID=2786 RepID=A0A1X6P3L3_PORUM|nr:hypothetical protein BU14_0239s0005 [Porphyra umbilicalis]|eukprot:OSX75350.1 hypothetical protein BU14_0239s0005 [Porphyra umbilicalis]